MNDAIELLEDMKAKHKEKNKLKKDERLAVEKELGRLLTGQVTIKQGVSLMMSFPADIAANGCQAAIQNMDREAIDNFVKELEGLIKFNTVRECEFLVCLIKVCVPLSEKVACRLLARLAALVMKSSAGKISSKLLKRTDNELLKDNKFLKINLSESGLIREEINTVAALIMVSFLEEKANRAEQISRHAEWLSSADKPIKLPADITVRLKHYEGSISPLARQIIFSDELTRKPDYGVIAPAINTISAGAETAINNTVRPSAHSEYYSGTGRTGSADGKPDYNLYLDNVKSYIVTLEEQAKSNSKKITDLESKLNVAEELRDTTEQRLKSQLAGQVQAAEKESQTHLYKTRQLETDLNRLRSEYESKLTEAENKNIELKAQLKGERDFAIEELVNVITMALSIEYEDFQRLKNKDMTEDMYDYLKHLTGRIFAKLKKKGCFPDRG